MSNNKGAKGTVCSNCMWVWDREGKRYAQTYDYTSWVNDGYKPIVCDKCLSAQGIKVVQPPSKKQIEREYGRVRAIIRLGGVPDGARGFASYGIIRYD